MWLGDIVANRFEIVRPIGSGGMGSVFLAKDRSDGANVAVKVLDLASELAIERFRREARVLSQLSHPGIVRHIAHGESDGRELYLVMELLEGEDLASRLRRVRLSPGDAIALVRRVAEGLAVAHARGIIHRDIKPSNLYLVGGDVERVKILDFGIARNHEQSQLLTNTGALLGTVGYMAPEQATGSREADARADVFSLGCVLFEVLTGRPAFTGAHAVAILAKVLTEEAPRVSSLQPTLGTAIDGLVGEMLAKDPGQRPMDAAAVVRRLDELGPPGEAAPYSVVSTREVLSDSERRIVSVILAERRDADLAGTVTPENAQDELGRIQELVTQFGGSATQLAGGSYIFILSGGAATDGASRAASFALCLRAKFRDLRIVIATGWGETRGPVPVGPVIDQAASLLRATAGESDRAESIVIDDITVGLLSPRFVVRKHEGGHVLSQERLEAEEPRLLLGRPTPCVGREKEIALLDATLEECVEDHVARAVLVTAPAGIGKSRLATEFINKLRERGKPVSVLIARADAAAAGSAFALAQRLVRHASGAKEGDPAAVQYARLREHVGQLVTDDRVERLTEFLGEIVGVLGGQEPSPVRRAALNDPLVMREQKRRAFDAWLDGLVSRGPLLLVLEDLHWGDLPTVTYLGDALRRLSNSPLMILALARPEVEEAFPRLWGDVAQEISLTGLSSRAAKRLARSVLGEVADDDVIARVVERADGNVFYLEELIRRVAEGDASFPDTVLAMAQSRLARLDSESRRLLRAASAFGETFWGGGAAALLGPLVSTGTLLESLTESEVLVRGSDPRFTGEREYRFRHALLREAAYGMLTPADRTAAHRMAGEWLEGIGEVEERSLADHFERGGAPDRAAPYIIGAARSALDGADLGSAIALANRGYTMVGNDADRGQLLLIHANALGWDTRWEAAGELFRQAIELLPVGSSSWWAGLAGAILSAASAGRPEEVTPLLPMILNAPTDADPVGPFGHAANVLTYGLGIMDQGGMARSFLEKVMAEHGDDPRRDPAFVAWVQLALSMIDIRFDPERGGWKIDRGLGLARRSLALMQEIGSPLGEASALIWVGMGSALLGLDAEAEAAWCKARESVSVFCREWGTMYVASIEARRTRHSEAKDVLLKLLSSSDLHVVQESRSFAAEAELLASRADQALALALDAMNGPVQGARLLAAGVAARAYLALGRPGDALEMTTRVLAEESGHWPETDPVLLCCRAEALREIGDADAARKAIAEARDFLMKVANAMDDSELRDSYLRNVTVNARILGLAEAWTA